jgi:NAD(P)-dependent dehydrogenase (short-subunit alcohol dehydrogenase family)
LSLKQVCIVTGGNTGVGLEVCKILYSNNATVYLAGRSEDKCRKAISSIVESLQRKPTGELKFLKLDLADLSTIKASADEFLGQEIRLDWLCNNAGVMLAPAGSKGAQVRSSIPVMLQELKKERLLLTLFFLHRAMSCTWSQTALALCCSHSI